MDRDAIFEAWAPVGGRWSPWVKPMLFARADPLEGRLPPAPPWVRGELFVVDAGAADYRHSARAPVAVVVDLPGEDGVAVGLALTRLGFRAVPVYSSLPGQEAVVPMDDVVRALVAGAAELRDQPPPPSAAPAFLVDARRAGEGVEPMSRWFDNRSMLLPTDFPSADALRAHAIAAVVVVQAENDALRDDLERVLAGWQRRGLALARVRAGSPGPASPLRVRSPGIATTLAWWWRYLMLPGSADRGFGVELTRHGG